MKRGLLFAALLAALAAGGCEDALMREAPYDVSVPHGIRIETAAQLAGIGIDADYPADGEYYLGNDIDLSPLYTAAGTGPPYVWRPIGSTCRECGGPLVSSDTTYQALPITCRNRDCPLFGESQPPFSGVFHGNGKTVSGLKLSGGTETDGYNEAMYIGLFGYISGAYIHGLTVELANTAEERVTPSNSYSYIAALAALAQTSFIKDIQLGAAAEDCGLYVNSALVGATSYAYAGGAAGRGYNTRLANITSSLPLDVDGNGSNQIVGGIAGNIASGEITGTNMTGAIAVNSTGVSSTVAGICASAAAIKNCTVTMDTLILTVAATSGTAPAASLAGVGGAGTITDCSVDIGLIKLEDNDTSTIPRAIYVGGIAAQANGTIERCSARFNRIEVTAADTAPYHDTFIGGLAGDIGTISNSYIEGDREIAVNLPSAGGRPVYLGGLAGQGNVSRSHITGGFKINITTGNIGPGQVNIGGLAGNGVAEYSFIGSSAEPVKLNITKTNTTRDTYNTTYAGGISGQASVNATRYYQYNYSFCDVTLVTGVSSCYAGGLIGYINRSGITCVTGNYAAGSVTITNDSESSGITQNIYAGGIAGGAGNNANFTINKNASLNSVTIGGSNSSATKTWRRIVKPDGSNTKLISNITTVTEKKPDDYTLTDGANTADGLFIDHKLTKDDFFGSETNQLGWDEDVWGWDVVSGYPVLK
ncbi:MAG: hypothetical protein LBJ86_01350 [Spirochaetaceae bacterium]|jgi:hypothetical protein|nr:hypothetical protein [Spirochaetaceae bacterium]